MPPNDLRVTSTQVIKDATSVSNCRDVSANFIQNHGFFLPENEGTQTPLDGWVGWIREIYRKAAVFNCSIQVLRCFAQSFNEFLNCHCSEYTNQHVTRSPCMGKGQCVISLTCTTKGHFKNMFIYQKKRVYPRHPIGKQQKQCDEFNKKVLCFNSVTDSVVTF